MSVMTGSMILGFTVSPEILVVGALAGMAYAMLGAGLVLVYRATNVLNLAHGEMGAFGAAILAKLVLDDGWNFWLALAVVCVIGGGIGALVEIVVIRRLRNGPQLSMLVATIGIAQLMFVGQLLLPEVSLANAGPFPSPLDRSFSLGNLVLRSPHFMVLAVVPAVIGALAYFLTRTPWGLAIRAAADNPDAAELAAISTRSVATRVWILAGVLSTLTAVLVNPLRNVSVGGLAVVEALGPGLLLRALVAALVGRLVSLPLTLVGGIAIGIVEALVFANVAEPAISELVLFMVTLALLLLRGQSGDQRRDLAALSLRVPALPVAVRRRFLVRRGPTIVGTSAFVVAAAMPFLFDSASQTFLFGRVLVFAMVGLSVTMLTGWGGQLSLGQFAFVGIGAMTTAFLTNRGMPFGPAMGYSIFAGALAAVLVGFPALRLRGLFLAVVTLAFAIASRAWFFTQDWFLGDGSVVFVQPGKTLGMDFDQSRTFYLLCLVGLAVTVVATNRLRASGVGRSIIAMRDNEAGAAAMGLAPAPIKLLAFVLPGAVAAFAGSLLAGLTVQFGADTFSPTQSLSVVAMTVIGGLGSVVGAILGAVYVLGVPAAIGATPAVQLATSGIGVLVLLLWLPGGLAALAYRGRDLVLRILYPAEMSEATVIDPTESAVPVIDATPPSKARPASPGRAVTLRGDGSRGAMASGSLLSVDDVSVRFGGLVAVDNVSVHVGTEEIVGLIGTNGAGKSTLMDVISGFTPAVAGTITLDGTDITGLAAHRRARLGLGRVFQDARLFPGLRVREALQVALEHADPSHVIPVLMGYSPASAAEARKFTRSESLLDLFGLRRYADVAIGDLSTGTRRIVELACIAARGAKVMLLDEPTAGVAQRESEAMAGVIERVRAELGASILIIEHDMPLIMAISDRVQCLSAGQTIALGDPETVRRDPAVVAAYLGTDDRAIDRSDRGDVRVPAAPNDATSLEVSP